jgi:hypothetical protein
MAYCFFSLVALLFPCVLAGCRDISIGSDTGGYVEICFSTALSCSTFQQFQAMLFAEFEPLYNLLTYTVASLTPDIAWLLFTIQFIIILLIWLSANKLRNHAPVWFFMFLYFLIFYGISLNMTRQMLAMAFCLYSFAFLTERKFLKSILAFLPALGFHSTAFIYLILYLAFYFFVYKAPSVRKVRLYEIIAILGGIILVAYLGNIIKGFISLGMLTDKFSAYATNDVWGASIPVSKLTLGLVCSAIFLCVPKREKHRIGNYYYYEFILWMIVIFCFSGLISTFAVRGGDYFSFLLIIILPMTLYDGRKIRNPYKKTFPFIIMFFLFYWYMTIVIANLSETYPYTSKILGINY